MSDETVGYGMLSPFDLDHFEQLLIPSWGTWYAAHLIRLLAKADVDNRNLLRLAYPEEVAAFERWYATGSAVLPSLA